MKTVRVALVVGAFFLGAAWSRAEVVKLEILKREPFAGGKAFGDTGPYEKIAAIAHFAVDPADAHNQIIVDLDKAPRNAQGKVEFSSDVSILAPKDPTKGNGAAFYDVNNRGNKLLLRNFNLTGGGNDLDKPGVEGDGFLMRRGYTIVWCGWIGEILPGDGRMLLKPPIATDNGKPIRGLVRFEMSSDNKVDSVALSRREGHGSYAPTKEGEAKGTLTYRLHESDERKPIPREKWSLIRLPVPKVKQGVPGTLGQIRLKLEGGFRPGVLYELICECENPIVQGTGLAATRDLISFLRYESSDKNPLRRADGKPALTRAHAFGVSQSGRFLRHFLWQGFNEDEQGRIVFDGLMPHVAGGGLGFFNHRFAQPTRHNGQHEDHTYPADQFPFTYGVSTDPFSKKSDGILQVYAKTGKAMPKVMHTQSAAEYWHRSGSLVHTDPLGTQDAAIPKNVRIFAFGGTQHGPAADPPMQSFGKYLPNPGDYRPLLRALIDALDDWVRTGKEPPASLYPRIADKTLVAWDQKSTGFPSLPGVRYPDVIQQPFFGDFGPRFAKEKIIAEPPKVLSKYTVLVPKCGADGNDLGTLLPAEVAVPLATFTGWNLRRKEIGAENQLASLLGSFFPLPRTKAERMKSGDPRLSIEERCGGFDKYQQMFNEECTRMVKTGYLLQEDAQRLMAGRKAYYARLTK